MSNAIEGYSASAKDLIQRYEDLSSADLYASMLHLFPGIGSRILDVGASTGRDAAWLADQGCEVIAAEPVMEFIDTGKRLHPSPGIHWVQDSLPKLSSIRDINKKFDFIMISGVWQHINNQERKMAMPILRSLITDNGRMLLSVRHGPCPSDRPCFEETVVQLIDLATEYGLSVLFEEQRDSIQKGNRDRGVTWSYLVFGTE